MPFTVASAAIVGATGPAGIHLAAVLGAAGARVRAVSRNPASLARLFPGDAVEKVPADALDGPAIAGAIAGVDLVVDCIGLPAAEMHNHAPTAANIAAAVRRSGARLVQVSSYWAYLPVRQLPVSEIHPRHGGNPHIAARRAAEDILQEAGAAIVHLPDFYGPYVQASVLQQALRDAASGKSMKWIGGRHVARDHVFVPDAMRIVAALARQPEAYGQRWIVSGGGPITGAEVASLASRHLGRTVRLHAAGPLLLRLAALFDAGLRDFRPMLPHYLKPISFDSGKLARLLGPLEVTPHGEAIPRTLDWLLARPPASAAAPVGAAQASRAE